MLRDGSSGRAPTQQAQGPEFKTPVPLKKEEKKEKNFRSVQSWQASSDGVFTLSYK
jgi:hypothetical protein